MGKLIYKNYQTLMNLPPFCYINQSKYKKLFWSLFLTIAVILATLMLRVAFAEEDSQTQDSSVLITGGSILIDYIFSFNAFTLFDEIVANIGPWIAKISGTLVEDYIAPIGLSFMCLWCLIDLIDLYTSQNFTLEQLWKKLLLVVTGIIIVANIGLFVGSKKTDDGKDYSIPAVVNAINEDISDGVDTMVMESGKAEKSYNKIKKSITKEDAESYRDKNPKTGEVAMLLKDIANDSGFISGDSVGAASILCTHWKLCCNEAFPGSDGDVWDYLKSKATAIVPFIYCAITIIVLVLATLIASILGLLIFVMKAGALIEMCVRGIFLPIGISDISRGLTGPMTRYLKKYIACGLQISVITVTAGIGRSLGNALSIPFFNATRAIIGNVQLPGTISEANNKMASTAALNTEIIILAIEMVGVYFLIFSVCMKASQLANDIMGT